MLISHSTQLPLEYPSGIADPANCGEMGGALRCNYYSVKNGSYVPFASADGLRALYHAEVCTEVVSYLTKVEPVRLKVGRRSPTFKPHFQEALSNGRTVVSMFADLLSGEPEQREIIEVARTHYAKTGIGFRVCGHGLFGQGMNAGAVEAIQTFRRTAFADADILLVKDAIGDRSHAPLAEIRDHFKSPALGFAKLSAMMVRRIVAIKLDQELGPGTPVQMLDSR